MSPAFIRSVVLGAAVLCTTAATASAVPMLYVDKTSIPGSTAFTIDTPGGSGPGWGIPLGTAGYVGSTTLTTTAPGLFSLTYYGAGDSRDPNEFFVNGNLLFCSQAIAGTCAQTPLGTTQMVLLPAGPINYGFFAGSPASLMLPNGSTLGNVPASGGSYPASIFAGCVTTMPKCTYSIPGNAVWLGLTDLPGNLTTGDHDFQDLAVRVQVIPEPASLGLLVTAFLGLDTLRRRRRARG